MTAQSELLSVSLEILAFFFVTTDLYGKDRLEALGDTLSSTLKRLAWLFRYDAGVPDREVGPLVWVFGAAVTYVITPFLWLITYFFFMTLLAYGEPPRSRHDDLSLAGLLFWGLSSFSLGCLAGWVTIRAALPFMALNLTMLAHWLLERARVSGVLLGSGTILFLIAKAIIWLRLFHEITSG